VEEEETKVELKFPIVVWVLYDDGYVLGELKIHDWAWRHDVLRIYIKESTIKKLMES